MVDNVSKKPTHAYAFIVARIRIGFGDSDQNVEMPFVHDDKIELRDCDCNTVEENFPLMCLGLIIDYVINVRTSSDSPSLGLKLAESCNYIQKGDNVQA